MTDNSAARLASILQAVKDYPNGNQSALEGWKAILDVSDDMHIPAAIAEIYLQEKSVVKQVMALPAEEDPDHLLLFMPRVTNLFLDLMQVRGLPMQHFIGQVTTEMVYSLQACANALRRYGVNEPDIEQDKLQELIDLVREASDEVAASDLPYNLKLAISLRLGDVEAALSLYRVGGAEKINEALDLFIATSWRLGTQNQQESSRIGLIFKKVMSAFTTAAPAIKAIAGTANEVSNIIDGFTK